MLDRSFSLVLRSATASDVSHQHRHTCACILSRIRAQIHCFELPYIRPASLPPTSPPPTIHTPPRPNHSHTLLYRIPKVCH